LEKRRESPIAIERLKAVMPSTSTESSDDDMKRASETWTHDGFESAGENNGFDKHDKKFCFSGKILNEFLSNDAAIAIIETLMHCGN
jgi:hypothetical protein